MYPMLEKTFPKVAHKLSYNLFFTPIKYKAPSRELPIIKAAGKYREDINNKSTQFYTWGKESNPLVVLVHGWMGRAGQFYKIIEALVERQYFVIAFDGPAHGASSGTRTSVIDFANAIHNIEAKFGRIHFAIGHSFGGITVLHAIKKGVNIKDVAFISTPTIADDIVYQFEQKINASPATGDYFRKKVLKKYGVSFKSISASESINEVKLNGLYIIHDDQDKDVGIEHAELLKERFPRAETLFTTGLGHTRILRNNAVITSLVNKVDQFRA